MTHSQCDVLQLSFFEIVPLSTKQIFIVDRCMSVVCQNSSVFIRQIGVFIVNNVQDSLLTVWCYLNDIIFHDKSLFRTLWHHFVRRAQCSCLKDHHKMADDCPRIDNLNTKNGNFICGVVEGKFESIGYETQFFLW